MSSIAQTCHPLHIHRAPSSNYVHLKHTHTHRDTKPSRAICACARISVIVYARAKTNPRLYDACASHVRHTIPAGLVIVLCVCVCAVWCGCADNNNNNPSTGKAAAVAAATTMPKHRHARTRQKNIIPSTFVHSIHTASSLSVAHTRSRTHRNAMRIGRIW